MFIFCYGYFNGVMICFSFSYMFSNLILEAELVILF